MKRGLFSVCMFLWVSYGAKAQVRINEFLADNVAVFPDNYDYDDFSDWIELYNSGNSGADIGGYYLTGDIRQPKKWKVPEGTSIPAKGYLLIWADGNDGKPGQSETREWYPGNDRYTLKNYHAAFRLDKEGEQVALFDDAGAIVDSVTFPRQFRDVSMGRTSDGVWALFDEPTPGSKNSEAGKPLTTSEYSGDVVFSLEGGMYGSAQKVTLTSSDGSDIHYTIDGSIPYAGDPEYSGPISVSKTTVIRARTVSGDKFAGRVITNSYFIGEKDRTVMIASLTTDPGFLDNRDYGIWANDLKGREVPASLEFFTVEGERAARFNCGIRNGTLTSFGEAQHPLQVALRKRYGEEYVQYGFFTNEADRFSRFRLRQGGDAWANSFIGDALLDPICTGQTEVGIQAFRPVVSYVNGVYHGLYNLREQFKEYYFSEHYGVDPGAIDEVRSMLVNGSSSGMAGEGWILEAGSWDPWRSLMSLVKSGTMDASRYDQVKELVDIASKTDFICLVDFGKAISWGHNEDVWKVPDGRWKWLVTDFDRAWVYEDNFAGIDLNQITEAAGVSGSIMQKDTLFSRLMGNNDFKNYFIQRYAAHLNSTFKVERLTAIVDSIEKLIEPEMADHSAKWGSEGGIRSVSAWKREVGDLRKFMTERPAYCWKHLESSPFNASGGRADLSVKISPSEAQGEIFINGVRMSRGITGISLYKGIPFQVRAVGKPGWACKGWEGGEGREDSMTVTLNGDRTVTALFERSEIEVRRDMEAGNPVEAGFSLSRRTVPSGRSVSLALEISLPHTEPVTVDLYSITGTLIERLMSNYQAQGGRSTVHLRSGRVAAGIYCIRIIAGRSRSTRVITIH